MITRALSLAAAAVLVAVALTGCVRVGGPMTSESRDIDDVTAVVLETSGHLEITEGEPSLTIHAPENLLDALTSDVSGGVLELGRRGGGPMFGSGAIRYELSVASLDSIEIDGSGDVTSTVSAERMTIEISGSGDVAITGLDADQIAATIDGSGDVELAGDADALTLEIDGSGEVDADDLEVVDASVVIGGSGDATLHVTGTLAVEISGSGTVRHRGGAEVDADISGSGDVESD
ncbi:head GIN domain-containing protein [Pseudolysinimonas sp.]|jgi:hypothetical protein|uniref:head GIN domain-containing protein n=1 Tax=Pseudolysinimonas sp. TaxID=2680009 RepID=UPI0037852D8A